MILTLIATLIGLIAYLVTGGLIATRNLPRAWVNARSTASIMTLEDDIRGSVKIQTICMVLFWPVYLPGQAAFHRLSPIFNAVIDAGDPVNLP